jgi:hypothetical protein
VAEAQLVIERGTIMKVYLGNNQVTSGFLNMISRSKSKIGLAFLTLFGLSQLSFADDVSHNYINTTRTSYKNKIFVSEALDGEYGDMKMGHDTSHSTGNSSLGASSGEKWQGYSMTTTLGIELMKFLQFTASHSSVNLKSTHSDLEKITGSRFMGGAKLVFLAPVANLEIGGGIIGTRYDYQKDLDTAGLYGSGVYYSLGLNYFTSDQVSVFGVAKLIDEHSVKNGGSANVDGLTLKSTDLGVGVALWL